jgi:hypothetical protein
MSTCFVVSFSMRRGIDRDRARSLRALVTTDRSGKFPEPQLPQITVRRLTLRGSLPPLSSMLTQLPSPGGPVFVSLAPIPQVWSRSDLITRAPAIAHPGFRGRPPAVPVLQVTVQAALLPLASGRSAISVPVHGDSRPPTGSARASPLLHPAGIPSGPCDLRAAPFRLPPSACHLTSGRSPNIFQRSATLPCGSLTTHRSHTPDRVWITP